LPCGWCILNVAARADVPVSALVNVQRDRHRRRTIRFLDQKAKLRGLCIASLASAMSAAQREDRHA
jgi:hypothetical protein